INDALKALGIGGKPFSKAEIKQMLRDAQAYVEDGMAGIYSSVEGEIQSELLDPRMDATGLNRGFDKYFRSTALDGVQAIEQPSGTPSQWMSMIADRGGKGTAQELEWIGLEDFMNDYMKAEGVKSVPKEVVEQYIKDNQIQVDEVTLKDTQPDRTVTRDNVADVSETDADWIVKFDNGEKVEAEKGFFESQEDAIDYAVDFFNDNPDAFTLVGRGPNETKYASYTVPGGENYREVLLTFENPRIKPPTPVSESDITLSTMREYEDGTRNVRISRKGHEDTMTFRDDRSDKQIIQDIIEFNQDWQDAQTDQAFRSNHFDEANILAHVRVDDRTLQNGERVMFLNEIQSDWAQEGRQKGFRGDDTPDLNVRRSEEIQREIDQRLEELGLPPNTAGGQRQDAVIDRLMTELESRDRMDAILEYDRSMSRKSSRPADMPYKKTDQWVGMAIRRMMSQAAEQGYDRIAWVTGEQAAELYDLSKQVDKIDHSYNAVNPDDGNHVDIHLKDQGTVNLFVKSDGTITKKRGNIPVNAGDNLSDVIGKDLAEKVLNLDYGESLSGEGLKVGGEGMKTFYNKIVPKVAAKEAKRFDKEAKVEVVEISERPDMISAPEGINDAGQKVVNDWQDQKLTPDEFEAQMKEAGYDTKVDDFNEIEYIRPVDAVSTKQLSIKLSDTAKAQLADAVPLFQIADDMRFQFKPKLDDTAYPYRKRFDSIVRKFQDRGIAAKRLIDGSRDDGARITDQSDFYQDDSLKRGRVENQLNMFRKGQMADFIDVMQRGNKELGITHEEYYKFFQVRHAPDVNARLEEQTGFPGLSGYSDQEIAQWNSYFNEKGYTEFLENEVAPVHDAIAKEALRKQVAYGLITPQAYKAMTDMYPKYTPMRGFEDFMDIDPTMIVMPERQKGRTSKPGDSIAYLIGYMESTILRGETNLVKEKVGKFAEDNYDRTDLMELKNVYWRDTGKLDPETGKKIYLAETDKPSVQELLEGKVVRHISKEDSLATWPERDDPFFKGARQLRFMRRGKPMVVEFTAPHIAEWLKGNDVDNVSESLKGIAKYMGYLRNAYITYSPEFPLRNAIRDGTTGVLHIATDFDSKTAAAVGNPARLARIMPSIYKAVRNNDYSGAYGDAVKKFLWHGGKSGYYQLNEMKRLTKDLQEAVNNSGNAWYQTKKGGRAFHDLMQSYTSTIENLIRISGYDYFLENDIVNPKTGKPFTEKQAAAYFKDLTVNFDRKGSW
ncbi:MAG: hypothetical protein LAT56_15795, partial [Wenzhouxiangella sp.]|nr:hypothetical protein [Wenzhouxiangella sp.]